MLLLLLTLIAVIWSLLVLGIVTLCMNAARGDRVATPARASANRRRLVA